MIPSQAMQYPVVLFKRRALVHAFIGRRLCGLCDALALGVLLWGLGDGETWK